MQIDRLKYANNGADVDVYIDTKYSCRLSLDTVAEYKLYIGKDLTENELEGIIKSEQILRLFRKSINYISIRPRSVYEEIQYLNKQKINVRTDLKKQIIDSVLEKLKEKKYLDDNEFCKWLIDNRIAYSLKSKMEIKSELSSKGVEGKIIRESINIYYNEEIEKEIFEKIFQKKYGNLDLLELDRKKKLKISNYFQRKGFNYQLLQEKFNI